MKPVHLEGMGLMGSLVAHQLAALGIPFTWHDTDERITAWKACTGIIYPSGEKLDNDNYKRWFPFPAHFKPFMEEAAFCHYSTQPPHKGKHKILGTVGGVKVSDVSSYHFNAQRFVQSTRLQFLAQKFSKNVRGHRLIVTHGFHPATIWKWSWGWSAQVEIAVSNDLKALCQGKRPCLYMRDNFVLDYAYPIPGWHHYWYAGTSLITQKAPHSCLGGENKLRNWYDRMKQKAQGAFAVRLIITNPVEGWRPMPHPDLPWVWQNTSRDKTIYLRPMYGSGLRHFWTLWDELERVL
jgi:hypothetical protein